MTSSISGSANPARDVQPDGYETPPTPPETPSTPSDAESPPPQDISACGTSISSTLSPSRTATSTHALAWTSEDSARDGAPPRTHGQAPSSPPHPPELERPEMEMSSDPVGASEDDPEIESPARGSLSRQSTEIYPVNTSASVDLTEVPQTRRKPSVSELNRSLTVPPKEPTEVGKSRPATQSQPKQELPTPSPPTDETSKSQCKCCIVM